jgi:adenosylhomocysteine nucleosidase
VIRSGPGPERAAAAAARAVEAGAALLVSWGLAGGLAREIGPGSVIVPRRIVTPDAAPVSVAPAWRSRLAALADEFDVHDGDLLSVAAVLESPAAKRAAALATGAVAVDTESAAMAAVAARARVPFVALRVVVDGVDDALPPGAEPGGDEHGRQRVGAVLRALARPAQWRGLWLLMRRYRVASRVLERLARSLAYRRLLLVEEAGPLRAEG